MRFAIHVLKKYLFVAAVFLLLSSTAMADIVVIASSNSSASSMSADEIKKIYLGKSKKMKAVDQPKGSSVRASFLSSVVGKSESQFKAYWSKKIFSGKGVPPKSMDSEAVRSAVAGSDNTIGYIDSKDVNSSVKVIYTVK